MSAEVLICEATRADRAAIAFSLGHLGEQSHYQRFLAPKPVAMTRELERLLAIDHWHHEVLLAISQGPRVPVGVSEYVRLEHFDTAELAISVIDGWQRRGVGAMMLHGLRDRALAAGIRRFSATMLRENRGALALARTLGAVISTRSAGTLTELLIELDPGPGRDAPRPRSRA
jgi:acetyltransferase